ncbi:GGDEF domain-containing protein [Marinomonas algicola]|uniref:GGDEF domain-containing protein n=1 Tax=Marinomonas algicola TaxID=2773454 RepID=UPI001747EE70|nr:GGDEF domain-containing protein [Marinomonas algicola]
MNYFSKKIDDILFMGVTDRSDEGPYNLQITNLSYLLTLCGITFTAILYMFWSVWPAFWFQVVSVFICVIGVRLNLKGFYSQSAIFLPFFLMGFLLVSSFFFIGSSNGLHWVASLIPIYAFSVFHKKHYLKRVGVVLIGTIVFFLCELLAPNDSVLITSEQQIWMRVYSFCMCTVFASFIMNLLISRLIKANTFLKRLAEVDELTGISNRRKVLADAVNVFASSILNKEKSSFAIIDLDHFKKINDTYGHDAGDLVLRDVAQTMANKIGTAFKLGRYGGEEFVIVMPNTDKGLAQKEMEAVRKSIESLYIETKLGIVVPVTVSIGISSIGFNTSRYEELLSEADQALYEAKNAGRNQVQVFSLY